MINLEKNEKLIIEVHKHNFVFATHAIWMLVFAFLPVIISILIGMFFSASFSPKLLWFLLFLYMIWLICLWLKYFKDWTDHYLDAWYVTDEKVYDVNQVGFFHREISVLPLENIQDITVRVSGMFATFLDFGRIHIQTSGEDSSTFTLDDAKGPKKVRETVMALKGGREDRKKS